MRVTLNGIVAADEDKWVYEWFGYKAFCPQDLRDAIQQNPQGEELVAVLAHLDVVPPGTGWTEDPFGGRIRDGRIYGRGAMDDKGPAMAALYALLALKESRIPLQRRVRLIFGLNEESGSRDMRYYRDHGGELPQLGFTPDGEYPVINGEKGLVNETYRCSWSQTGPLRLTLLEGGQAHNIVPAEARAVVCCPPEQVRRRCPTAWRSALRA